MRELTESVGALKASVARAEDTARHLSTTEHSLNATREEVGFKERYVSAHFVCCDSICI